MSKQYSVSSPEIEKYVQKVFRPEDPALAEIRARAAQAGLPDIHVGDMDGLHLEVLARTCQARKIVEIGTLAGYSGVCLARGLQAGGRLYTFEFSPKHAEVAMESFRRNNLSDQVQIFVGPAIDNLAKIEKDGPFDLIFIDADKPSYPAYLEWSVSHLRKGGIILADNTFAGGDIVDANPKSTDRVRALDQFNRSVASDTRLRSTILPTSDGLTFAVRV